MMRGKSSPSEHVLRENQVEQLFGFFKNDLHHYPAASKKLFSFNVFTQTKFSYSDK